MFNSGGRSSSKYYLSLNSYKECLYKVGEAWRIFVESKKGLENTYGSLKSLIISSLNKHKEYSLNFKEV